MAKEEDGCQGCNDHTFTRAMHLTDDQVRATQQLLDSVSVRPYRPEQDSRLAVETAVELRGNAETVPESATHAGDGFINRPATPVVEPQAPPELPVFPDDQPSRVELPATPAYHFMNESPAVEGDSSGSVFTNVARDSHLVTSGLVSAQIGSLPFQQSTVIGAGKVGSPALRLETVFFNLGSCGEFAWNTRWELTGPAPQATRTRKTYVFQNVHRLRRMTDCYTGQEVWWKIFYTEAWEVSVGETRTNQYYATAARFARAGVSATPFDDQWKDQTLTPGGYDGFYGWQWLLGTAYVLHNHELNAAFKPRQPWQGDLDAPWGEIPAMIGIWDPSAMITNGGGYWGGGYQIIRSIEIDWVPTKLRLTPGSRQ